MYGLIGVEALAGTLPVKASTPGVYICGNLAHPSIGVKFSQNGFAKTKGRKGLLSGLMIVLSN